MAQRGSVTTAFSDRGVTFDQILHDGRLGGLASLRTYVASRRVQLLRKLASVPVGTELHRRYEAAHAALVAVEGLLPRLADRTLLQRVGSGASYLKGQKT
jgi:hypothetical protein